MTNPVEKDSVLFRRDLNGDLLPESFTIENFEAYLRPLAYGEIQTILSGFWNTLKAENYILLNNVFIPKFAEEELPRVKPSIVKLLIAKVYEISGLEFKKSSLKVLDEFAKRMQRIKEDRKEGDWFLFMHRQGYNFLNIHKLSYPEINTLLDAWNREQTNKEMLSKPKGKK